MDVNTPIPTVYGNFNEKFGASWTALIELLQSEFGDAIESVETPATHKTDLPIFFLKKDRAVEILTFIKEKQGFHFLTDYTATDEESNPRFHLVIHLMNPESKCRIRIKIKVGEKETFPTLIPLWIGANWAEREIWDMFGIIFEGHPDLRRILMDMRWEGHPLRKDYPLKGYQVFLTPEPLDPELLK